jgi:enoyl-CoA hydratase
MEFLLTSRPRAGVLLVTLNRPTKRNALNVKLTTEIAETLRHAEKDDDIRAVVITGDEKAFSAGADISDQHHQGADAVFGKARLDALFAIRTFGKPLIGAVDGYALGGGCELMMRCDIVIAGSTARFGLPEINLGIFPGDGATQMLTRLVGRSNALRLILSGEHIDAQEAFRIGLVSEVVEVGKTVGKALDLAELIASKSTVAVRLAKEAVAVGEDLPHEQGLLLEQKNLRLAFGSQGQREGMAAFVGKRSAVFNQPS